MPEAAKLSSGETRDMPFPILPSINIGKLKQTQLKKFVPNLLQNLSDGSRMDRHEKPVWWPKEVPWQQMKFDHRPNILIENISLESLKRIVVNCYKYFGQERLLNGANNSPEGASSPLSVFSGCYPDLVHPINGKSTDQWSKLPSANLRSKSRVVNRCLLPDLGDNAEIPLEGKACPFQNGNPFVEVYICFFCEKEFKNKQTMVQHQSCCSKRPSEFQNLSSVNRFVVPKDFHQSDSQTSLNSPARPPKKSYMRKVGLVACQKAKQIKAQVRESTDVDCEIIDVIEAPRVPATPPRTPKSLISQLSRDETPRRKSMCNDMSDSESVTSTVSETEDFSKCARNHATLLTIPLTSILGQRIRKHVKVDGHSAIVDNVDQFCKTPVKNDSIGRLRERQSIYPVTYKQTKRLASRHYHVFKFNKKQTKEFLECVKVGLSKRALRIFKKLRFCSVKLKRLSKSEIDKWTKPKTNLVKNAVLINKTVQIKQPSIYLKDLGKTIILNSNQQVFPAKPALLSADVDRILGLKKKEAPTGKTGFLPLGSIVSEDLNAEASQQKLTVYRSLLSDYSSFHSLNPHLVGSSSQQSVPNHFAESAKEKNVYSVNVQNISQLARMLRAPISEIPKHPTVNHVEKWLTNNKFTSGDKRLQFTQSTFQKMEKVGEKLATRIPGIGKRELDLEVESSAKRRKVQEESMDVEDRISICTASSSEDEQEVSKTKNTVSNNDGLPVIQNTFSLASGQFNIEHSDPHLRLVIPPNLNLRVPSVNVQQMPMVRTGSQRKSDMPRPKLPDSPLSNISAGSVKSVSSEGSKIRMPGHYTLRSTPSVNDASQSSVISEPSSPSSSISMKVRPTASGTINGKVYNTSLLNIKLPHSTLCVKPVDQDGAVLRRTSNCNSASGIVSPSVQKVNCSPIRCSRQTFHENESLSPVRRSRRLQLPTQPQIPIQQMRVPTLVNKRPKMAPKPDDEVICID